MKKLLKEPDSGEEKKKSNNHQRGSASEWNRQKKESMNVR